MTQEIQSARADVASVPLDPFKVAEAVNVEVTNRFEKVRALLEQIIEWSQSTKYLPDAEVETLSQNNAAISEVHGAFMDRANASIPEQAKMGSG